MVEGKRIISEEIFSYTEQGTAFHNHEWLSQILFYVVDRLAGANGLILFKALIVLMMAGLLYRTARFFEIDRVVALLLIVTALAMGIEGFRVRPQ